MSIWFRQFTLDAVHTLYERVRNRQVHVVRDRRG